MCSCTHTLLAVRCCCFYSLPPPSLTTWPIAMLLLLTPSCLPALLPHAQTVPLNQTPLPVLFTHSHMYVCCDGYAMHVKQCCAECGCGSTCYEMGHDIASRYVGTNNKHMQQTRQPLKAGDTLAWAHTTCGRMQAQLPHTQTHMSPETPRRAHKPGVMLSHTPHTDSSDAAVEQPSTPTLQRLQNACAVAARYNHLHRHTQPTTYACCLCLQRRCCCWLSSLSATRLLND